MEIESAIRRLNDGQAEPANRLTNVEDYFSDVAAVVFQFRNGGTTERLSIARRLNSFACGVVASFAQHVAKQALSEGNPERVREGLAAIALEAGRTDPRDSLMALYALYESSESLHLDTGGLFEEGSALLTDSSWPGFPVDYRNFVGSEPRRRFSVSSFRNERMAEEVARKKSPIGRLKWAFRNIWKSISFWGS